MSLKLEKSTKFIDRTLETFTFIFLNEIFLENIILMFINILLKFSNIFFILKLNVYKHSS